MQRNDRLLEVFGVAIVLKKSDLLFVERVVGVLNQYIEESTSHNVTLLGYTFNTLHKGDGIARAHKYLADIMKYQGADNEKSLVEKVFFDVTKPDGVLGTSTVLRLNLRTALFEHLGLGEKQLERITFNARASSMVSMRFGVNYGAESVIEQAKEDALKDALYKSMQLWDYETKKVVQGAEMLVR